MAVEPSTWKHVFSVRVDDAEKSLKLTATKKNKPFGRAILTNYLNAYNEKTGGKLSLDNVSSCVLDGIVLSDYDSATIGSLVDGDTGTHEVLLTTTSARGRPIVQHAAAPAGEPAVSEVGQRCVRQLLAALVASRGDEILSDGLQARLHALVRAWGTHGWKPTAERLRQSNQLWHLETSRITNRRQQAALPELAKPWEA